jgi:hypothetical protein
MHYTLDVKARLAASCWWGNPPAFGIEAKLVLAAVC